MDSPIKIMKPILFFMSVPCSMVRSNGYSLFQRLRRSPLLLFTLSPLLSPIALSKELPPDIPDTVLTFVENYCLECHDDLTSKGDRDFLPFLDDPTNPDQLLTLEDFC